MTILIPAFEPDERLVTLIKQIKEACSFEILVIDDGSGEKFQDIFNDLRNLDVSVVMHAVNKGKGCALKTGFAYIMDVLKENEGVMTADADGQHLCKDILRIADKLRSVDNKIILGERNFAGKIPLKSSVGNWISLSVFNMLSGQNIKDTQTGLRGFSSSMLPWLLTIEGDRYEYEMNVLLKAGSAGYGIRTIDIETVYIDSNKSSHFRPVHDSFLVIFPFLKFCVSGFSSAVVDYVLLFLFQWITQNLLFSVIVARIASSAFNFVINKLHVFNIASVSRRTKSELIKYYILVCILLTFNYFILLFLSQDLHIPLFWSKLITELTLFTISYPAQRFIVFKKQADEPIKQLWQQ